MTAPEDQDRFTGRDGYPQPTPYGWYNGTGNNLENYNFFQLERFAPTYNMEADYNTNAKSFYDYLSRFNGFLDTLIDSINQLLRRQITVKDSNNIHMERHGDWYTPEDVEELEAFVKISTQVIDDHKNGVLDLSDGIFVKDFTDDINKLFSEIQRLDKRIDDLNTKVDNNYNDLLNHINEQGDSLNKRIDDTNSKVDNNYKDLSGRLDKVQQATFNPDMPLSLKGTMRSNWQFNGGPDPDFSLHYALVDSRGGDNPDWLRWAFGINWVNGTYNDGIVGTFDLTGTPIAGKMIAGGSGVWLYSGNVIHLQDGTTQIPFFNITQEDNTLTVKIIGNTGNATGSNSPFNINAGGTPTNYSYIG